MKLKSILNIVVSFILIISVSMIFVGCKEDELAKLFEEGELGDFFVLEKDNAEIVIPEKSDDADFIDEDEVLNMDAVKWLANGGNPFSFMKKFPVPESEDSGLYYVQLPNDYAIRIEFSGDTVNLMYLEDNLLGKSLDLREDSLYIETFLLERE